MDNINKSDLLNDLWLATAKEVLRRVKDGSASAADMANAIRFIREGAVKELEETMEISNPKHRAILDELADYDFQ